MPWLLLTLCPMHRSALSHITALQDPSESLPVPPWPRTPAKQAQSRSCGRARLQAARGCPFSPECSRSHVGASASSPWQEESLRKVNTRVGEGALSLSLLKKDIIGYWKLNAKLKSPQATVVVVQACYLQKVCLIINQTYELYSRLQKSLKSGLWICEKIRPFWGKTWRWFWKSSGQQEEAGSFLDNLGLDHIGLIIPCKHEEIRIRPQSTGIILLGESHCHASVWIAQYSTLRCLFIIPCRLWKGPGPGIPSWNTNLVTPSWNVLRRFM